MTDTPFNEALRRAAAARAAAAPEVSEADADEALARFVEAALLDAAEGQNDCYSDKPRAEDEASAWSVEDEAEAFETLNAPSTLKGGALWGIPLKTGADYKPAPLSEEAPNSAPKTGRRSRRARTEAGLQSVLDAFTFDWFQGVVPNSKGGPDCIVGGPEESSAIGRVVQFFEAHGLRGGEPATGGKGYATSIPFYEGNGAERVGCIASGSRTGGMPNLTVSGGHGLCALIAPRIQAAFPGLRITRADAALDVVQPGAFEALLAMTKRFAAGRKMTPPRMFGTDTPEKGRTFYVGSRSAEVMLRVYEKGLQLNAATAARAGVRVGERMEDVDWVRIEFQFSGIPGRKKAAFGALNPGEMVAAYAWPRAWIAMAAAEIGLTDGVEKAARIKVEQGEHVKDLETTTAWGAAQYGKAYSRAAIIELKRERAERGLPPESITHEDVVARAAELFARKLIETDKTERVMRVDMAGAEMTPEDRATLLADRQQALHAAALGAKERALRRLALAVIPATRNPETADALRNALDEATAAAVQFRADRNAINAEWAVRERERMAEDRRAEFHAVA